MRLKVSIFYFNHPNVVFNEVSSCNRQMASLRWQQAMARHLR